ncbi:MAG: hypothetical protein ACKPKO_28990 [Candidatus Fonsibacter sp.]
MMGYFIDMRHGSPKPPPPPPKTQMFPITPPPSRRGLSPPTTQTPKWTYYPTPKTNPNMWKPTPVPSPTWRAQCKADTAYIGQTYLPKAPPIVVPEVTYINILKHQDQEHPQHQMHAVPLHLVD